MVLTYQQVIDQSDSLVEALAIMVSGQWPDGTNWALPTSTAAGTVSNVRVVDGTNLTTLLNGNPVGTEYALPVRNIPSGVQPVSAAAASPLAARIGDGTNQTSLLNAAPSGTEYALPVRNIPSGVQSARVGDGTNLTALLNANPAGTEYALPVRNIPSGVQVATAQEQLYNPATPGWENRRTPTKFLPIVLVLTANTDTALWTPAAGLRFRMLGYVLNTTSGPAFLTFKDGVAGTTVFYEYVAAAGRIQAPPLGNGLLSGAINRALVIQSNLAMSIYGYIFGTEE